MALYLDACIAEGDAALIAKALGDIARAKGMTQVARDTGLSRESLYKALSGERPRLQHHSQGLARAWPAPACHPCLSVAWQPSYDAVPEPGAPIPVAPFRLPMTASRLLSAALLLAAFSSSAAAEDCVAAFDSAQSDYRRAQSAQDALEATRGGKLDGTLCQGRLDLLDLRFELADRYEVCARDGGTFPADTAGAMDREAGMLASQKSDWIKVCGPLMK